MCVTVYSTTSCGVCKALVSWLEQKGVPTTKINVDTDPSAMQQLLEVSGGAIGVPFSVIEYQGKSESVAGFDRKRFEAAFVSLR